MTRTPTLRMLLVAAFAVLPAACKSTRVEPAVDSTAAVVPDTGAARGRDVAVTPPRTDSAATEELRRLEREAAALANAGGCGQAGDCRTAPVGDRPCGGPRYYLVYCARTTDSTALYRKLDELARAERAYNQQKGMASTCEFRTPPAVAVTGGSCRAAP